MHERPFFPIFFKHKDKLSYLTMEQRGQLMTALFDYAADGIMPEFDGIMGLCFSIFRDDVDSSLENYQKTCEQNRKNIQKRWAKKSKNNQEDTDVYEPIPDTTENTNKKIEVEAETEDKIEDEVEVEAKRNIHYCEDISDRRATSKNNNSIFNIFESKFGAYPSECMQKRIENSSLAPDDIKFAIDKALKRSPRNPEAYLTALINKWEIEGVPKQNVNIYSSESGQGDELEEWEKDWLERYKNMEKYFENCV